MRISACIVSNNHQAYLANCLKSLLKIAHEIILVDIGSDDLTLSVAKAYGAKTHSLPRTTTLSQARNYGMSQASHEWIMMVNCNEVVVESALAYLPSLITSPKVEGYEVQIHSYSQTGVQSNLKEVRLFRNLPFFRYAPTSPPQLIDYCTKLPPTENICPSQIELVASNTTC